MDYLRALLNVDSLSPHGICLLWRPELIWTHVISDALIGLAYFSIPVALAYFISRRPDIGFHGVFWAFAVFILACGTTHFISIWTLWVPDYGAEALVKAATAIASVATALALWPMLPRALAVPSPAQLQMANQILEQRVHERDEALSALRVETSEREKAEAMLRQAQKMEAIGQLTGGVAHDFNNLLTAVVGNLEVIGRRAASDKVLEKAVANATMAADRAATLTQQLLAFARKQPLQPALVDASDITRSAVDLIGSTLGDRVTVNLDLSTKGETVLADPVQLENALLNLAVNARDAMPDGGTITFRTRIGRDATAGGLPVVFVEVCDDGSGMPADVRERATEPFFTTKAVGRGSGLGLSQVHGFTVQSKGRLEIDSSPGRGTIVRLCLPVADSKADLELSA